MDSIPSTPTVIDAVQLLREALAKLEERGTQYDNTGQQRERSAPMIGRLFAAAADRDLTDREIWLLMQQVKRARLHTAPGHVDSIVDLIAYTALEGEAMIEARKRDDMAKEHYKMVPDGPGPRYPSLPPKLTKEQLALQLEALTPQERCDLFQHVEEGILYRPLYPTHKANAPDTGEGAREDYELSYGKHKGKTLEQVLYTDPGYLVWLHEKDVLTIHEDFMVRIYHRQAAEDEDTGAELEEDPYADGRDNVPEY